MFSYDENGTTVEKPASYKMAAKSLANVLTFRAPRDGGRAKQRSEAAGIRLSIVAQIRHHERAPSPSLCSHSASFDLGITPGSTGVREKPL